MQKTARRMIEVADQAAPKKAGRPAHPLEHYEEVAAIYIKALREGKPPKPTDAVQAYFNVSKGTAAKWVYRCRRPPLNLLAPTVRGRAAGTPVQEVEPTKSRRTK